MILPSGMDGVGGLSQKAHPSGQDVRLRVRPREVAGTFMYHPHADEMVQMAMGMMGLFIVHPKDPALMRVDRDFCFLLAMPMTSIPAPTCRVSCR